MKKLILFCCVVTSVNCFGQSFMQGIVQRLSFGVKAGANYSNFTNTNFATDPIIGFYAGGLVNFKLTDKFSIQEEFLFSFQGAKIKDAVWGENNAKLYYMNVPILLRYRTKAGIYFEAGTQVGLLITEDVGHLPISSFAKKIDFGAAVGLGFQSKKGFGCGTRYIAGMSGVGNFNDPEINSDFRNSLLQAGVSYNF